MTLKKAGHLTLAFVKNSIMSWYFAAAVALYFLILFISTYSDFLSPVTSGAVYFLHYAFMNGSTVYFLPVLCAMAASTFFCREWTTGCFIFSYTRAGKREYVTALHACAAIIGAAVCIAGTMLYFLVICTRFPVIGTNTENAIEAYANGGLIKTGHIAGFIALTVLTQGAQSALLSSAAVCMSLWLVSPYLTMISPMVIHIVITNFMNLINLPRYLNPYYVFSGFKYMNIVFGDTGNNEFRLISGIYPILYSGLLIILLSVMTGIVLKHKYERRETE